MHSFEKKYNNKEKGDELSIFLNKNNNDIIGSYKLDGAALLIEYNQSQLIQAYTKGRKDFAQKSDYIAKKIKSIPQNIIATEHLFVKCELIIYKDVFLKKYASEYSNPRNLVAGILNKKTPSPILSDVVALAHSLETVDQKGFIEKVGQWNNLKTLGFTVVDHFVIRDENTKLSLKDLENMLMSYKQKSNILCDGIVLEYNKYEDRKNSGYLPNQNPAYGVAYKLILDSEKVTTTVTEVQWNISKQGYLIPRVKYSPVHLNGTICTYASGKNAKFIKDQNFYIGVTITLIKGGDIIPDIIEVNQKMSSKNIGNSILPKVCPSCGSKLIWGETEVNLVCTNKDCAGQFLQKATHFFKTIGVEGISESTVEKIIEHVGISDIDSFLYLKEPDFIMGGLGKRTAKKIYEGLHNKLQNVDLAKLAYSTGLFDGSIGSKKIQWVIDTYGDFVEDKKKFKIEDITKIPGFEKKSAEAFINSYNKFLIWYKKNNSFINYFINQKIQKTGKLTGKVFVFTGFRDKDLEKQIEDAGGQIASGVSKKVTTLIVNDINSGSSKITKAQELGINIIEQINFKI